MGANLSLLAPHAHTVAPRSYVDVFSNFEFLEVINNSRFLKTMKAYDRTSGMLVTIKIFIKPVQTIIDLDLIIELLAQEALLLARHPNVLAWHLIIETSAAGYLVRQLAKTNLYDRLSIRPFLAPIEKLWLVYQLLRVVELLHDQLQVCHGDIKTENILITGSNWLVLTDFAQFTKPVYLPDDNPSEFVFYFDSSNRRSCYVAPERFYSKSERNAILSKRNSWALAPEADLFSVGCVIAELYLDGEATFTLSDLYRYKRGENTPNLARIQHKQVQKLVKSLLTLDPDSRPSASDILSHLKGTLFPTYFYNFLYDFMCELYGGKGMELDRSENCCESDRKIDHIYTNFHRVVDALGFTYKEECEKEEDKRGRSDEFLSESGSSFPYLRLGLPGVPKLYKVRSAAQLKAEDGQQQGALMLLDTVFSLLGSLKRPESKVRACEIILALSERVYDESKLDRSLPYICSLLEDFLVGVSRHQDNFSGDGVNFSSKNKFSARVACVALITLTNLLQTCSSINEINALVFPEYICPLLKNIAFLSSPQQADVALLKCSLARCFPHLVHISENFKWFLSVASSVGGDAVTPKDDDMKGLCQSANRRVEPDFKDITEALLTDGNVDVRATLVNHILPLCQFFGVDKTNDIILPHLITYLNDASYELRLAFLSCILRIGEFIGILSFEQYILPLLMQILTDHEPFIVLKVLEIFHYFVSTRLINPAVEFNAWSIYKDMLQGSILLLLQPIEWIRQDVVFLIVAISDNLLDADRFCFLYPLIKQYLAYDISAISWNTLYPSLTRPILKQVMETALSWLLNANSKSLFWAQTRISVFKYNGRRKLVSFSKDMGRSVYAGRSSVPTASDDFAGGITLGLDDRQWVLKLKSVGLDEKELWKVFALKDYLVGVSRSGHATNSIQHAFELDAAISVSPLTIFFDIFYHSEPLPSGRGINSSVDAGANAGCNVSVISQKDALSLVNEKARASLQTSEATVFGELQLTHELSRPHIHHTNQANTSHRIISTSDAKIISTTIRHNYAGSNPYILRYLRTVEFDPLLNDFPEFGPVIKEQLSSQGAILGAQVASFNLSESPRTIDSLLKSVVCPSSTLIITGSVSGTIRVWDTAKLEQATGNAASLTVELGLAITDIVFIPHRWVFAVGTIDGQIRLFRVHATRGKNRKLLKLVKLVVARSTKLDSGYAKSLQFASTGSKSLCVACTSSCHVVGYDVIKMEKVFEMLNLPQYGMPLTFVAAKDCAWLLVGTSEGVLCLWDVRFQILLSAWRVAVDGIVCAKSEISALVPVPVPPTRKKAADSFYFAMTGGTTEADITVWEMPTFACRLYFSLDQDEPTTRSYTLQKLEPIRELSAGDMLAELSLDLNQVSAGPRVLCYVGERVASSDGYLVSVTGDLRVTLWNWRDVTRSILLFSELKVTFTKSVVSLSLCVYHERLISKSGRREREDGKITDLCFVSKPYPMLVTVKDDGLMHVYK